MSNDPLLQPFQLKHLTLRNRIIVTSHEPAYPEDGMPKGRYRAYTVERAKGGVAMTMTAGSAAVSKDSPPVFNNLLAYKDEIVPWIREMTDAVHEQGAAIMIQLTHLGRRTRWDKGDWLPVLAPSHHREAAHRAFPKKLEDWDIARIIKDFADAAERMKAGGMDGVELEAYGHLIDQFTSPLTNELDGPYGGSLENRMRFCLDVFKAMRERVGDDFILGVRYTADECLPGGTGKAEGLEISRRLKESGLIDYLNVIRGHIDTDPGLTDVIPIQGMASAPHLDFAGEVRAATRFPTFHAAKIQDVATARHAIAAGKVDMIGMTRAHMTDPHILRKIIEKREDDIRPCVGANYCLDRIYQGGLAFCIHNAATGREETMPHDIPRADVRKKVVVVGAGPAGLEAARVSAERGHEVVVFEAAGNPGGQIRLTAQSERRREMIGIIDWRMAQCEKRGVTFHFNTWAEAHTVLAENPDVVIIATGGLPHTDVLAKGNELVVSSWDIISGDVKPGDFLLIDDGKVRVRGLDLEAKAELTDKLSLTAAYSYMMSDIVENGTGGNVGNELSFVPNQLASLWVNYTLPGDGKRGDMNFGLGARYSGSYFFNDANTQSTGGSIVFDAAFAYKIRENTAFEVNVSNLFDEKHVDYGGFGADWYNPGRAVYATIRQTW